MPLTLKPELYVRKQNEDTTTAINFTKPRSGIHGRVLEPPHGYSFTRFVAFIMSEGTDYNFTTNIAPAWRVILGDGEPDYESSWFPVMSDRNALYGYGTIGLDAHHLALHEATYTTEFPE